MKRFILTSLIGILSAGFTLYAQSKQLIQINSVKTKEIVDLKYNNKKQLTYFVEKGVVTFREFTFKYDKITNLLSECIMNQDRGELITNSRYTYNDGYIAEEVASSGKQVKEKKVTDHLQIHIDHKGRLTKTVFEDGKPWEEFVYDENNNLVTYTQYGATNEGSKITIFKFNNDKSAFLNIESIPAWFWAWHVNSMRWCGDFIGKNNPSGFTTEDPRYGTDTIEVTYEYDTDGYPVKQFYNGELVREMIYKN